MLTIKANPGEAGLKLLVLAASLSIIGACRPGGKNPSQVQPVPASRPQQGQAGNKIDLPPASDTLFKSESYEYPLKGSRDPFKSVVQKRGEGSGENTVGTLDISNISLTGVIEGPNGRLALVHDNQGVGYVVQEGDQLIGGRVVAIKDTSIVFRQDVEKGKSIEFSLPLLRESPDLRINQ